MNETSVTRCTKCLQTVCICNSTDDAKKKTILTTIKFSMQQMAERGEPFINKTCIACGNPIGIFSHNKQETFHTDCRDLLVNAALNLGYRINWSERTAFKLPIGACGECMGTGKQFELQLKSDSYTETVFTITEIDCEECKGTGEE